MKMTDLKCQSTDELVETFKLIALEQDDAMLDSDVTRFNRLFKQMQNVRAELKSRPGDQRSALLRLYGHHNAQVRLKAAKATLAIAPEKALKKLRAIADSKEYPQAGEAGMSLRNLKSGIFKPT